MKPDDIKLIIFDLDLTLINSRDIKQYRDSKQWKKVFSMIPDIKPYPEIPELLSSIYKKGVCMAVVTSSPDMYCKKIIDHQKWERMINKKNVVGYHQTTKRKPDPAPINMILNIMNVEPDKAIHVGDEAKDTQAAQSAGVFAIGAAWDDLHYEELIDSKPQIVCESVSQLSDFLGLH